MEWATRLHSHMWFTKSLIERKIATCQIYLSIKSTILHSKLSDVWMIRPWPLSNTFWFAVSSKFFELIFFSTFSDIRHTAHMSSRTTWFFNSCVLCWMKSSLEIFKSGWIFLQRATNDVSQDQISRIIWVVASSFVRLLKPFSNVAISVVSFVSLKRLSGC